jgi:UDP-3-O-[3-hydroxymyristoyl] N-acetylglucosamine deacetylase / 3-hydroxyacyl-[acyl-carrier-protein] dehydratase
VSSSRLPQTTISRAMSLSGVGLHTGLACTLTFKPAPADTGRVFVLTQAPGRPQVHPRPEGVIRSHRGTSLAENGVEVHTVEHVLAALAGMGVDNCFIELSAPEPPAGDGSALPFARLLQEAGIVELAGTQAKVVRPERPVQVQGMNKAVVVWPHAGLRITYQLEYAQGHVPPQRVDVDVTRETFLREIAPCRTFCLESEIETLKAQGLAQGGSLENCLVLTPGGLKNPPLRSEHELAGHKVLDVIGDLALLGCRLEGHVVAERSGHDLNVQLVKKLQVHPEKRGKNEVVIDAKEIEQLLPHRYPMLLVDRILELEVGKRVVGIKNVTMNEHFFQGHFPGHPIMPGVLIVEAMAQCGGVLLMKSSPESQGKVVYFVAIDNVKFRKPVLPGDQLRLELEVDKIRTRLAKMIGKAYVGNDLVCEAELMSTVVDR